MLLIVLSRDFCQHAEGEFSVSYLKDKLYIFCRDKQYIFVKIIYPSCIWNAVIRNSRPKSWLVKINLITEINFVILVIVYNIGFILNHDIT